jgi:RNA polymerase sigma-70 factor (ECF subfamily)
MKPEHRPDHGLAAGEAGLIAAAVAGHADALQELVERYEPRVYRFAMRVCRNQEDAQEILQETFLNAIRSLATFRGDSQFATWLFRIVVTSCAKTRGRRAVSGGREIALDLPEGTAAGPAMPREPVDWSLDPEASSLSAEVREHLEAAIDRLPPGYKGVFLLRDIEGFSTADTAHILNLSPEAVKTRLHRAHLFLRDQLSRYFTDR